jgi:VCBS repeat-containing protein
MAKGLTIHGNNGNNHIVGSDDDDTITAGNGDNVIVGLAGNDSITVGNGNNTISDGDGNDNIGAGNGINTINVGNGNDTVTVGNNNNTIIAGNGNDTVTAGNGANHITVGDGTDTITVGNGSNTITVGGGTDTITVGNGSNTIVAGGGADTIHAGNGGNSISAGAGNDVITTGNGNDTINGGAGSDHISAGGGNDIVTYNMSENVGSADVYDGGSGTDTLTLELTHAQYASAAVQADLTAYNAFLALHANPSTSNGPAFHFTAFDLSASNFEHVNIVLVNAPVVITSGPESAAVAELPDTTGSSTIDTTATIPAGTLNFTDTDTGDTHTVATSLASDTWSGGSSIPAATQADLAAALSTTLHDSTGTGSGSIDWNFGLQDKDFDFLAAGETLTINYNVSVSDASTTSTQTVSVIVTGANDAPVITSGPEAGSVAELPNTTGSSTLDTTPTSTLAFADPDLTDTHQVSVALDSAVWSANPSFVPAETLADLQTALATALHDSTGTGSGGIDWTFSVPDHDLDFLSTGETLTATYDVTVSDAFTSSTQLVTITATGAADAPVVNPDTVAVADTVNTDAGTVVAIGNVINDASDSPVDLSSTLSITAIDGQAALVGSNIASTYGTFFVGPDGFYEFTANSALDQLQVGDSATEQHTITVTDSEGQSVVTQLTFNFTGADDAPTITGGTTFGEVTENAGPSTLVNGDFETGDLTGWSQTGSDIQALFLGQGGAFGNYAAELQAPGGETLSQSVATTPGEHYIVGFSVTGDPDSGNNSFVATWDGNQILALSDVQSGAFTHYTFDVAGDASSSTTALQFSYTDDGSAMFLDQVSVSPETAPATETTGGSISFADVETGDTHTASFAPLDNNYLGTFSLDPVTESSGTGSVNWHFTVNNADIQFLAQGQALTQDYLVSVTDNHGASTVQDVTVTINGVNEAPTAVSESVITDAGANGTVDIPAWALAANDTDPDTTDHVSVNSITSSSGGSAVLSGSDVFFTDDATPGGSFNYNSTDGIAVSSNSATATVINNDPSSTSLTGVAGDNILIATQGGESLTGGSGNNILIGNSGSHVMTGGGTSDTFAFLHNTDGPITITDFNNVTANDHIAVSASGFGGGLTAGMDVTPIFETTADNQFSGTGAEFHFDTANQTLYFSANGTTASEQTLAQVQPGVTLHPHDILIV